MENTNFGSAFDADLAISGMEQSRICELLVDPGEPVLTTAAISNWKKRNHVPMHRLRRLVEIFGPESKTAGYLRGVLETGPMPPLRPVRDQIAGVAALLDRAKSEGVDTAELVTAAFKRAADAMDAEPEVRDALVLIGKLLRKIPQDSRPKAIQAALMALAEYL